jgi:ubiquinone/menaquinone biosynthesis C-methylase UbiE
MNFICPHCHAALQKISDHELHCTADSLSFQKVNGIWKFLLPEREPHYARFIKDYEKIRSLEGRQSQDSNYYRSLPFQDLSGRFSADWKIRAVSYRLLENLVQPGMKVIDLGAGNGWLSNRLTARGCEVYAVDLLLNAEDGLGAWTYYENQFTPVQAEFSRLPFADGSSSLVIFNASFHYAEDYQEILREALRVIEPSGKIIIMDSPVYHHGESGEKMVNERKAAFLSQYGFASDTLHSKNYITYQQMEQIGGNMRISWKHLRPFYGIRWALRPWFARLRGRREPAEFGLWVGSRR